VQLEDFSLRNAPVLGRLMAAVFPTGLADLKSDGGLGFSLLKLKFIMKPDMYEIIEGRAHGHSLGLSLQGRIHRGDPHVLQLHGTIIPAYFFNTLISKIPLLGSLITGGKHEGMFGASFRLTGPHHDPQMSINPLSALTPGILRKLFSSKEEHASASHAPSWSEEEEVEEEE
jgi:hypothetical protein